FVSYLILYEINPNLLEIKGICQSGGGATGTSTSTGITTGPSTTPLGTISKECDKYDSMFQSAGGDKDTQCLLKAIAMQESSCNAGVGCNGVGSCGLMQIQPATAGMTSSQLNDPQTSINKAAELLRTNQRLISGQTYFTASQGTAPGTTTTTYGNNTYSTGNDDLIASYNAGGGAKATTAEKKGPFKQSTDCPTPPTPAWQCDKNPGGFAETQAYVQKVQGYQKQCLGS
ncbi:MAG: lytic transglycosylase domain-containing protein, partial [Parcubacteria group bacterium]